MRKIGKLEQLIVAEANKTINDNEKESVKLHNKICKDIVRCMEKYNIPIGTIIYTSVGTSAHKPHIFHKGYLRFDEKRLDDVMRLNYIFTKRFGEQWRRREVLIHALCRYIDTAKTNKIDRFKKIVKNCLADLNSIKIDNAKKLNKYLFDKQAEYSNSGYITLVKGTD